MLRSILMRAAIGALLVATACAPSAHAKFAYQPQSEGLVQAVGAPAVATLSRTDTALVWRDADPYHAGTKNKYFFMDSSTDALTRKTSYGCGGYPVGATQFTADPAVLSWGTGRLDVFGRGPSGSLVHYWKNGSDTDCTPVWSGAEDRGGVIVGRPVAVSRASNQLEVYVRGTDDQLYQQTWSGSAWSAWTALGGTLTSAPAAAAWSTTTTVFGVFAGGVIQSRQWVSGRGWGSWTSLAPSMGSIRATGSPAASSQGTNKIDLVFRATDGHLYAMEYAGGWRAPDDLGTNPGNTDPAVSEHGALAGELWTGSAEVSTLLRRVLDPYGASSLNYTALGDSYASGVGTRDYQTAGDPAGYACQRSPKAYALARGGSFHADYGRTWFLACGGAKSTDVLNKQVASIGPGTKVVTVSAGGNDAGFSDVVKACATDVNPIPGQGTGYGDCDDKIAGAQSEIRDNLPAKLDALYGAIAAHEPAGGYLRVVVVLYPRIFTEVFCKATAAIGPNRGTILNQFADKLDDVIKAAVARRNAPSTWVVADPRPTFDGHAVCSSSGEWINGLSDPIGESFHPNVTGWSNLGQIVVRAAGIDF